MEIPRRRTVLHKISTARAGSPFSRKFCLTNSKVTVHLDLLQWRQGCTVTVFSKPCLAFRDPPDLAACLFWQHLPACFQLSPTNPQFQPQWGCASYFPSLGICNKFIWKQTNQPTKMKLKLQNSLLKPNFFSEAGRGAGRTMESFIPTAPALPGVTYLDEHPLPPLPSLIPQEGRNCTVSKEVLEKTQRVEMPDQP